MSDYTTREGGTFIAARIRNTLLRTFRPKFSPATIHQDFEQDVLERLHKLGASTLGAPVVGVKATLQGEIKVMCMGMCPDGFWRKYTLRFTFPFLKDRKYLGDAGAVAEVAYRLLGTTAPK